MTIDTTTLAMETLVAQEPLELLDPDYSSRNNSSPDQSRGKLGAPAVLAKAASAPPGTTMMIPVGQIGPSPYNPRDIYDEGALQSLADSIELQGLIEPIIVRDNADVSNADEFGDHSTRYTIIAGERRWRAVQLLKRETIRAEVRKVGSDLEAAEITVSENFMREGFNPIEEAIAFRTLQNLGKKQSDIAKMVGRQQASISKTRSLLELPPSVQALIARRVLTASHGYSLHQYYKPGPEIHGGNETMILNTASTVVDERWTIRQLEERLALLFPPLEEPSLGLDVSPAGDQVFAGPHPPAPPNPPAPPAPGEFVHALHTGEITESVQMVIDAQNASTQAIVDRNAEDARAAQNARPALPAPLTQLGDNAPISQLGDNALIAAAADDSIIVDSIIAEPDQSDAEEDLTASPELVAVPEMPISQTPISQTPISQTPISQTPISQGSASTSSPISVKPEMAKPNASTASVKSESVKSEPSKPSPASPATPSLPPGWISAPIKEEVYAKARDMGLWPLTSAIEAFQELSDRIASLEAEAKELKSSAESMILEDGLIRLGAIPLIAGRKLEEWNRSGDAEVLVPGETAVLHTLHPDRDKTTLDMITEALVVGRFRRCRARGQGDGEEMPEGLLEALAEIRAQSSNIQNDSDMND